jgi:hypothetical protein
MFPLITLSKKDTVTVTLQEKEIAGRPITPLAMVYKRGN